jgi:hypothetical protein
VTDAAGEGGPAASVQFEDGADARAWRTSPLPSTRAAWEHTMPDHGDRKTRPTSADVASFLDGVADDRRRTDAWEVLDTMRRVTGAEPTMWGGSIVGFGRQPYTTADGKERDWLAIGLSPRKAALTLYGLTYYGSNADLLERLGEHSTGKGCLYVKRLDDVDLGVLEELVARAWSTNHVEDAS